MVDKTQYPRSFTITNGKGDIINLNSKDSLGYDPTGLGLAMDRTLIQSSHGSVVTNSQYAATTIKLSLALGFETDPYTIYHDIVGKLSLDPLILTYHVPNVGNYERRVTLKTLEKTEVSHDTNLLMSSVEFDALSPWRLWVKTTGSAVDITVQRPKGYYDQGNYMGYSYNYIYGSGIHTAGYAMALTNNSQVPGVDQYTGLKVIFKATQPVVNPSISILDHNYSLLQKETIYTTLYTGSTFTMNTAFGEEEYSLRNGSTGVVDDISRYVDPSSTGFLQVPIGKSIIQLGASFHNALTDITDPNIEIYVLNEWGGV